MDTDLVVRLITDFRADMNSRFERLEMRMDRRFEQVDKRFEQVDKRFEQVDKRFEQVDRRFDEIDRRFEQVDKRFDEMKLQITNVRLELLRDLAEVNGRLTTDITWGQRELRTRIERCESEIEELKRKGQD